MIEARVVMYLLQEVDLLPLTVLDSDMRKVSMMSLCDRLLDLYGIKLLAGISSCPLRTLVCLEEV